MASNETLLAAASLLFAVFPGPTLLSTAVRTLVRGRSGAAMKGAGAINLVRGVEWPLRGAGGALLAGLGLRLARHRG
jgi:threonine/homoserine/homoserine lactone efflux protein